jgi:hypothetical protein
MSKIRLTWMSRRGKIIEDCDLLSEYDKIYLEDGTPVPLTIDMLASSNWVVFEDEEGLFCLRPEQVVSIEVLG